MRNSLKYLIISAFVLGGAVSAQAGATLSDLKGKVLFNAGNGFIPASSQIVAPGSRIMVSPGSTARISFDDGCSVQLKPGLLTVGSNSPCGVKAQPVSSGIALPLLFGAAATIPLVYGAFEEVGRKTNKSP